MRPIPCLPDKRVMSPVKQACTSAAMALMGWVSIAGLAPAQAQTTDVADTIAVTGSYLGTVENKGTCHKTYQIAGHAPAAPGRYPLFLYFIGTNIANDPAMVDDYKTKTPQAVVKAMAQRGYVAYSVQYDNRLATLYSNRKAMMQCLFNKDLQGSLIQQLCEQGGDNSIVDCGLGITTWGHSLGGAVAIAAKNVEPRVRAAWGTGVGGVKGADGAAPVLSKHRIRIVNGGKDEIPLLGLLLGNNNDTRKLNRELGLTPTKDCPGQKNQCLRPDGSGWILVQPSELTPKRNADHCWFMGISCLKYDNTFEEVGFTQANSRVSINGNADWLVRAAASAEP